MGSNEPDPNARREAVARALWEVDNDDPELRWENVYARREYYERADVAIAAFHFDVLTEVERLKLAAVLASITFTNDIWLARMPQIEEVLAPMFKARQP